jgi:hypothetical protein
LESRFREPLIANVRKKFSTHERIRIMCRWLIGICASICLFGCSGGSHTQTAVINGPKPFPRPIGIDGRTTILKHPPFVPFELAQAKKIGDNVSIVFRLSINWPVEEPTVQGSTEVFSCNHRWADASFPVDGKTVRVITADGTPVDPQALLQRLGKRSVVGVDLYSSDAGKNPGVADQIADVLAEFPDEQLIVLVPPGLWNDTRAAAFGFRSGAEANNAVSLRASSQIDAAKAN